MTLEEFGRRARRWVRHRGVAIWYDPAYRLPLGSVEATTGINPRRADLVVSYLLGCGIIDQPVLRSAEPIAREALRLLHAAELVEGLERREFLADVFRVDPSEVIGSSLGDSVRLACGATLAAARAALQRRVPTLNLLGGFHHAGRATPGIFCPVNDVGVAIAVLRNDGFTGRVTVLDLDAHAPDGLADCVESLGDVWCGALSGPASGRVSGIDQLVLTAGSDDRAYAAALEALLARRPRAELAFVIAGGDVLATDRNGGLGLSLEGALLRDRTVARALGAEPAVWLPGGGYGPDAWKVLAGTATLLATGESRTVPPGYDPLREQFVAISRDLDPARLSGDAELTGEDLVRDARLFDYYTTEGLEHALIRYGIFPHLHRLGYDDLRVAVDRDARGERLRVLGRGDGTEHTLLETVLERLTMGTSRLLYVHWLNLRNPRARFGSGRPRLPGQDVPGLGLAREAGELFGRMAVRIGLDGIGMRPAWLHTAHVAHSMGMRFLDPVRHGRFEALLRDLRPLSLLEATLAVSEGRVSLNSAPYAWEADLMVLMLRGSSFDRKAADRERRRVRFELKK
jgi:acetoin utilization deacetylase AcuC-like enzyme